MCLMTNTMRAGLVPRALDAVSARAYTAGTSRASTDEDSRCAKRRVVAAVRERGRLDR
jgi:hypothetical protein